MISEGDLFKNFIPDFERLKQYGFIEKNGVFRLEKPFMNGDFKAVLTVSETGQVQGRVVDTQFNDEYLPLRTQEQNGAFVNEVRTAYETILQDIYQQCHKTARFEWMVPANPKIFDIDEGFRQNPELDWKQTGHVHVGDLVYIYMAAPFSAILYQCEVTKTNVPLKDKDSIINCMMLKLLQKYDPRLITRQIMKECGVGPVRGFRGMPSELSVRIRQLTAGDPQRF
ncbi:MAG: hypothetical protein IJ752_01430 [Alphaproteobacteria bacterium]|nr:hypothetical protein [Alphaproteobacteria bacterium]